jgi:hypothetical protein
MNGDEGSNLTWLVVRRSNSEGVLSGHGVSHNERRAGITRYFGRVPATHQTERRCADLSRRVSRQLRDLGRAFWRVPDRHFGAMCRVDTPGVLDSM